jgi:hypothetical protein
VDNCDSRPRALATPNFQPTLSPRKVDLNIVNFALRFPVDVLGPGEKSSRKATLEVKALSDKATLVGSRPEAREDTMVKMLLTVMVFSAPLAAVAADGQGDAGCVAPELRKPAPGQLFDEDYLTSTGETVVRPGVPQSSGETPFDRYIRQQNDRIDNSICKGC